MRKGLIAIIVLVVLVGAAMFFGRDTWTTAKLGTVYVAKQTCSCLFVAGRPMVAQSGLPLPLRAAF